MRTAGHVFGYGSLVAAPAVGRVTLHGHRRVWGVAMDNAVAIPGYKVYALPDGTRPAVAVAFLDLSETAGEDVEGALLEVDAGALDAARREADGVAHFRSVDRDDGDLHRRRGGGRSGTGPEGRR